LVGKPEGKRPLRTPKHRWENNIKMYVKEMGFEGMDWIHLAQDRGQWCPLVNVIMNLQVAQKAENFLISSVELVGWFLATEYLLGLQSL
jgi:hypothetical protein